MRGYGSFFTWHETLHYSGQFIQFRRWDLLNWYSKFLMQLHIYRLPFDAVLTLATSFGSSSSSKLDQIISIPILVYSFLFYILLVYLFNFLCLFNLLAQGGLNFFLIVPKMNIIRLKEPKTFIDHQAFYTTRDFRMMTIFIHTHYTIVQKKSMWAMILHLFHFRNNFEISCFMAPLLNMSDTCLSYERA